MLIYVCIVNLEEAYGMIIAAEDTAGVQGSRLAMVLSQKRVGCLFDFRDHARGGKV